MQTDIPNEPTPDLDPGLCHDRGRELQLQGRPAEAAAWYRAALAQAPERPESWANLGLIFLAQGQPAEAMACEREALRHDPLRVDAHNNLGIAAHAMNVLAEAENHFRGALRLDPGHANATLNLGVIRHSLGSAAEAETLYRRARELGADPARANNNLAMCLAEQERLDEAEAACRAALAAEPGFPEAEVNLAMLLLMRGRLREAWPYYEARWRVPPLAGLPARSTAPRWTGAEDLNEKKILVEAEQGFGDTLQFCRYAACLAERGAHVTMAVPEPLARIAATVPGVHAVVTDGGSLPPHDFQCPAMSLPLAFSTSVETIPAPVPYISARPEETAGWRERLTAAGAGRKLRVGLVWAGGRRPEQPQAAAIDRRRSLALTSFAPLAEAGECAFVSLQAGPPENRRTRHRSRCCVSRRTSSISPPRRPWWRPSIW